MMNAKRIAELARGLTQLRVGAIYALIACAALALALYSCSQQQQQPTPPSPPTAAIDVATPVPAAPTPMPAAPTPPKPPLPSAPTPTPKVPLRFVQAPDSVPLPDDVAFTQITVGKHHACALRPDTTALCWGSNVNGSLNFPDRLAFRQIAAGLNFNCGLRSDRAITCWGENNAGQTSPPDGSFDEITAGRSHACALDDGALICWGADFPDGAETIQELPPLSAIQAGAGFTCGLTPNADMACWNNHAREIRIISGPFASLGIGLNHTCAVRVDGSGICNEEGYLDYSVPTQPPPAKFAQIASGWRHACGINETSYLECWGSGEPGAQGVQLPAPKGEFKAVSIGWRNSCALRSNGHAVCWKQFDEQTVPPPDRLPANEVKQLSETFEDIKFEEPLELFPWPSGGLAVMERGGTITTYSAEPNGYALSQTILNLTDKVALSRTTESGMFSAALDPQFEEFPFLYVYYRTLSDNAYGENIHGFVGRLTRFRVVDGQAVKASELIIWEAPMPGIVHYGGAIRFGADGMLYLGIGDNAIRKNAQSLETLLGKIIRINVRGATPEQPYHAPPDNPFVNNPDARPEIWAYGLRNPWRMDFAPDGRIFVADVGHILQEEVSIAAAGDNLGWPLCEGNICEEGVDSDALALTTPIFTYGRADGCAIIGGVTVPWLNNGFVFGDYCGGWVRLLEQDNSKGWRARWLAHTNGQALSFGIGGDGTVYALLRRKPIMRLQIQVEEPHLQSQANP